MEVVAALVGGLIAGGIGFAIARYQHHLDKDSAAKLEAASRRRRVDEMCAVVAGRHHVVIPAVTTPVLFGIGDRAVRRSRWVLERPRVIEVAEGLAVVAAATDDETLTDEATNLWRAWSALIYAANTLCWSDDNAELLEAKAGYADAIEEIASRFEYFTAAWLYPDGTPDAPGRDVDEANGIEHDRTE